MKDKVLRTLTVCHLRLRRLQYQMRLRRLSAQIEGVDSYMSEVKQRSEPIKVVDHYARAGTEPPDNPIAEGGIGYDDIYPVYKWNPAELSNEAAQHLLFSATQRRQRLSEELESCAAELNRIDTSLYRQ